MTEKLVVCPTEYAATTELSKSLCTFKWRIVNFDVLCPTNCVDFEKIHSPCFQAGDDIGKESTWCLTFAGKSKHISCHLYLIAVGREGRIKSSCESISCRFKVNLGNDKTQITGYRMTSVIKFLPQKNGWGFPELIPIADLYQMKDKLLQNNTLHLYVQVEIHGDPILISYQGPALKPKLSENSTLEIFSNDFQSLLENTKDSDVKITCGDKTFSAHKIILSARSKVFRAMFEADMAEAKSYEVDIVDMGPETVRLILKYIYTGKIVVPDDSSSWTEMIHGAEKYDLQEMKNHCFAKLMECFTDETIGILAVAAKFYNADLPTQTLIKSYCQKNFIFLMKNSNFKELLKAHPDSFF